MARSLCNPNPTVRLPGPTPAAYHAQTTASGSAGLRRPGGHDRLGLQSQRGGTGPPVSLRGAAGAETSAAWPAARACTHGCEQPQRAEAYDEGGLHGGGWKRGTAATTCRLSSRVGACESRGQGLARGTHGTGGDVASRQLCTELPPAPLRRGQTCVPPSMGDGASAPAVVPQSHTPLAASTAPIGPCPSPPNLPVQQGLFAAAELCWAVTPPRSERWSPAAACGGWPAHAAWVAASFSCPCRHSAVGVRVACAAAAGAAAAPPAAAASPQCCKAAAPNAPSLLCTTRRTSVRCEMHHILEVLQQGNPAAFNSPIGESACLACTRSARRQCLHSCAAACQHTVSQMHPPATWEPRQHTAAARGRRWSS